MQGNMISDIWRCAQARLLLLTSIVSLSAAPAGPEPQVPEGGQAPGAFPNTSVTGVNVVARGSTTFNSNVEVTAFDGQGPISWSLNRYNRGDFALRLAPRDPVAALSNLNQGFIDFADSSPGLAASQAWRPSPRRGVVIPTARQNGPINWNDGEGPFFPTVAVSEASSAPGYDMITGAFANGNLDLNTGRAGTHESSPEANFSFSATWFPYDQGWLAGEVGVPDAEGKSSWTSPDAHAVGLTAGNIKWRDFPTGSLQFGGLAEVIIPGVNSVTGGMLFATSSDGGSDVNIVGVSPNATSTGWLVAIREDSAIDTETLATADQSEFQFVYIPYTAPNLIGGHIAGGTGEKLHSQGSFTLTRTGTGIYELTIPGKTGSSGTLILQAAGLEAGTSEPLPSRDFLSYQFQDGKFIIQSRATTSDTTADLRDTDFYFAWIDFQTPLTPPAVPTFRALAPVALNDELTTLREAGLGVNTHEPEVLVTTIDAFNTGGYIDPITTQTGISALVGYFINPITLERTRDPFVILANPFGNITRHDVVYNAFSKQYVVVATARTYGANSMNVPMIAIVNPNSVAGVNPPVVKAFTYDENTTENYDDIAVAASDKNGNFIVVAEHAFAGEGEGTVGVLFNKDGALLTLQFARLDTLQPTGDEDDPDVKYLPGKDVFLYTSNTDMAGGLANRVTGAIIQTVPGDVSQVQVSAEQPLATGSFPGAEGHPASMENPFNGEILTVFDLGGNNVERGGLSYVTVGPASTYTFTQARPAIQYLAGTAGSGDPFKHNHPQIAADPDSGVIIVGLNANGSTVGNPDAYVFNAYGPDGAPLPSQLGTPYFLADTPGGVGNSAIFHNIKYSPVSDSFLVVFNTSPGITYIGSLEVTSNHLLVVDSPIMQIAKAGQQVLISWPDVGDFVLQFTDSLNNPDWKNWVATTPVTEGGLKKVTVDPSTPTRFFRLISSN